MLVADIHHVSLNVADTQRALGFYRDLLGMMTLPRPELPFDGAWLDAGHGHEVHLIESAQVPADVGQHVAFRVADIDGVVDAVRAAGYEVGAPRTIEFNGARQTFVLDPDGNRVEFNQPAS